MRQSTWRAIFVLCLMISFFSSSQSWALASRPRHRFNANAEEMSAPDFTLESLGGKTFSFQDLNKGKGVILFFFTTWCPYCRQKIPSLVKEYSQYQSQHIELVVIDVGESRAKVDSFATKENLPFDILLDIDMKTAEAYGVIGVPTFILVSKEGTVVYAGNDLPDNYAQLLQ